MKKTVIVVSCFLTIGYTIPQELPYDQQVYSSRYKIIKNLLNKYKRPITVLEFGVNKHAFSFDIAKEYDAKCIILDTANSEYLLHLCNAYNYNNIVLLNKELSLADLERLSECEHFDIVLIFNNSIGYNKKEWKQTINALLQLGDYIFLEVPTIRNVNHATINNYLSHNKGNIIAETKHHNPIFLFNAPRTYLARKYWTNPTFNTTRYTIKSTFKKKLFIKKRHGTTSIDHWHAGINLLTFKQLGGIYPSYQTIRELLEPLKHINHNDLYMYNIIIQGKHLVPIDYNDQCKPVSPQQTVTSMLNKHFADV